MEIKVKITKVNEIIRGISKSGQEWTKMEFIGQTLEDRYPKTIAFVSYKDSIERCDVKPGLDYVISFDLSSRSFVGKDGVERWSTDVSAWKATTVQEYAANFQPQNNQQQSQPAPTMIPNQVQPSNLQPSQPAAYNQTMPSPTQSDDLPF
ncbi:MAG: DUF3127 domain-containing protein [Prevotellaceae bacterium]|nr:DUF3127 domain-containing protein [Candidatus Faecinaster equi]